jgi:hypothetical protein
MNISYIPYHPILKYRHSMHVPRGATGSGLIPRSRKTPVEPLPLSPVVTAPTLQATMFRATYRIKINE